MDLLVTLAVIEVVIVAGAVLLVLWSGLRARQAAPRDHRPQGPCQPF
jgi:hypothetical protein